MNHNPSVASEEKSMVIIGAGVAGLASGCYARMNGYQTHIVEMAPLPGGVCTSWRRQGYVFDGSIEWLMGSRAGSGMNKMWQELGALVGREVVDHDEFMRVEGRDGQTLVVYTNADRLEQHLCELAPADAATSHLFCDIVRAVALVEAPPEGTWLGTAAGVLPAIPNLARLLTTTWQGFSARFTDRFVRDAFRSMFDLPDFPFLAGVMMLASMHARDAGYPIGGSLAFSQAIEQRYRELGGEITYGARVEQIVVEDDRAVGVRLADGTVLRADLVVSAADGHSTIFDMLGGRYVDESIRRRYTAQRIFSPLVQVSLGVARDLSNEPHAILFPLRTPVKIAGETRESLMVRHYGYDPTMAPPGKTAVVVMLPTNYDTWLKLAQDSEQYAAGKRAVADAVVAALDERFPGLAAAVEVTDVATPLTWASNTGNWRGAFEGWLPTRGAVGTMFRGVRDTLPGLSHFYMVGQWITVGGGVPGVASAGRNLVKRLCKLDGKPFVTTSATHPPARLLPDFGESGGTDQSLPRTVEPVSAGFAGEAYVAGPEA